MGIASLSPVTVFSQSVTENYKLKNLLAKVQKVLTFLWLAFFNLEKMIYLVIISRFLKSGSHLPKKIFICFNDSPSKMMKNAFYFILKSGFILKIFKFLS